MLIVMYKHDYEINIQNKLKYKKGIFFSFLQRMVYFILFRYILSLMIPYLINKFTYSIQGLLHRPIPNILVKKYIAKKTLILEMLFFKNSLFLLFHKYWISKKSCPIFIVYSLLGQRLLIYRLTQVFIFFGITKLFYVSLRLLVHRFFVYCHLFYKHYN